MKRPNIKQWPSAIWRFIARPFRNIPNLFQNTRLIWITMGVLIVFSLVLHPLYFAVAVNPTTGTASGQQQEAIFESVFNRPEFTYSGSWDLMQLQRHIEAGDVVAVTYVNNEENQIIDGPMQEIPSMLAAKTTTGDLIRVNLSIEPVEALAALRTMGYGGLMTEEANTTLADSDLAQLFILPEAEQKTVLPFWVSALQVITILTVVGMFIYWISKSSAATAPIGQTKDKKWEADEDPSAISGEIVRMSDVAGCDEAKLELAETIEFLKHTERFAKVGAKIPRGILLFGPPGTGKTLLAKALSQEAGVPFYHASASEFMEKYVGVGASRVRELFSKARKNKSGVIFIDELDAIARTRGGANSHEEREQTLNQILVEMDGFETLDQVVVVGATNRLDVLDPAVLRPGRFTRKVHVGLPDKHGRLAILKVHSEGKPFADEVDMESWARKTAGMSGAQLADLLNEASILCARRDGEAIHNEDMHLAFVKEHMGTSRRRSMEHAERIIIAVHELGHAICGKVHGSKTTIEEISLFAHGDALGVTISSQEDNSLPSQKDLEASLISLMGGRAAEDILFHDKTPGASSDFKKANQLARNMVVTWGMGKDPGAPAGISGRGRLGFLSFSDYDQVPAHLESIISESMREILDSAYETAYNTILDELPRLLYISFALFNLERIEKETFEQLFENWNPDEAELSEELKLLLPGLANAERLRNERHEKQIAAS